MSKVTSLPVPACCKDSASTCGCQPKGRSLLLDGSSQKADLAVSQTQGILGVLVDNSENILIRAAADVDEIDEASSDTLLPWSPRFFDTDPLSKIHVVGDEVQRKQILDLCEEYRDIFSNELDETPAIVPLFDLKVDETKWKVRANRAKTFAYFCRSVRYSIQVFHFVIFFLKNRCFYSHIFQTILLVL
jgi:hypothetical protein